MFKNIAMMRNLFVGYEYDESGIFSMILSERQYTFVKRGANKRHTLKQHFILEFHA
jgi:hypothetical protein